MKIEIRIPQLNGNPRQTCIVEENELGALRLEGLGKTEMSQVKKAIAAHPTGAINFCTGFHVRWG